MHTIRACKRLQRAAAACALALPCVPVRPWRACAVRRSLRCLCRNVYGLGIIQNGGGVGILGGILCRVPWRHQRHLMPCGLGVACACKQAAASLAAASFRTAAALAACALRCINKAAAFIKCLENVHNTCWRPVPCTIRPTFQYYRPTD